MENITLKSRTGEVIFDFENNKVIYNGSIQKEICINEIHEVYYMANGYCAITRQGGVFAIFYTQNVSLLNDVISKLKSLNTGIIFKNSYYIDTKSKPANKRANESNSITTFAVIFMVIGVAAALVLGIELDSVPLFFGVVISVVYLSLIMSALGKILIKLNHIDNNTRK